MAADKIKIGLRFFIVIIGALRIDGFEIGKAEVQEFFCVAVMRQMTVQDNGDEPQVVAFRTGDQGIACGHGITCFAADDARVPQPLTWTA